MGQRLNSPLTLVYWGDELAKAKCPLPTPYGSTSLDTDTDPETQTPLEDTVSS